MRPAFFVLLWTSIAAASFLSASTGPFESKISFSVGILPGSQRPGPFQVDRTSSHDISPGSQSGSCLPSFWSPCGDTSILCLCRRSASCPPTRSPSVGLLCAVIPHMRSPSGGGPSRFRRPFCEGPSGMRLTSGGSRHGVAGVLSRVELNSGQLHAHLV